MPFSSRRSLTERLCGSAWKKWAFLLLPTVSSPFIQFPLTRYQSPECFCKTLTRVTVIEGGKTENLSAKDLAELGFCAVAYPWTLVAAKLKSIRETLQALKQSMTVGAPPMILSYSEVCEGVGFNKYWELEESYKFDDGTRTNGHS